MKQNQLKLKNMPVLFVGHGSPMNAIEYNEFTNSWKSIAQNIPKPKAIVCISAHWITEGTAVTAMSIPRTIHDFYGFSKELYQVKYPANGSLSLAKLIQQIITTVAVQLDYEWGLDHGTWSVLNNMYPKADIPVLQLSLDYQLSLAKAFNLGKELHQLREKGILIISSGNIVHNLMMMDQHVKPYEYAVKFDDFVKKSLRNKDHQSLINYSKHKFSSLAHPSNEHYLPLIYALGAAEKDDFIFFNEKIVYGSVSMSGILFSDNKLII